MSDVHIHVRLHTDMMPGQMHTVESVLQTTEAVLRENLHTYVEEVTLMEDPKKLLIDKITKLMDETSDDDLAYILYHNPEMTQKLHNWVNKS